MQRYIYTIKASDIEKGYILTSSYGKLYRVDTISSDLSPGDEINILVPHEYIVGVPRASVISRHHEVQAPVTTISNAFLFGMLMLSIILFALQIVVMTTPFSVMSISPDCLSNYKTGSDIQDLYFNLFNGVGTDELCQSDSIDICIKWSNSQAWNAIDIVVGNSNMQNEAKNNWPACAGLVSSALGFLVIILALLISALFLSDISDLKFSLTGISSFFLWLVWILNICALNTVTYTDTLSSKQWLKYVSSGVGLDSIIDGISSPTSPQFGCSVGIDLSPGASTLSVSVGFGFFVALFVVFSACMGLCLETANTAPPTYYRDIVVLTERSNEEQKHNSKSFVAQPVSSDSEYAPPITTTTSTTSMVNVVDGSVIA